MTSPIPIRLPDLNEVVRIHVAAFPQSVLTRLGPGAVRRYYQWQLEGPHECHAVAAIRDARMAGFCFAGVFRGAMRGFVRRHAAYLAIQLILRPWLLRHGSVVAKLRVVQRILQGAGPAPGAAAVTPPSTGQSFAVLSIATHPEWEGRGVGRELMAEAERTARAAGYERMHLTVRVDNHRAIAFYERLGWHRAADEPWSGLMTKSLEG